MSEGLERGWERVRGREKRKIETDGQLLAVFECGRVFAWRSATRQIYVRERTPPAASESNRLFFNCANHFPLSQIRGLLPAVSHVGFGFLLRRCLQSSTEDVWSTHPPLRALLSSATKQWPAPLSETRGKLNWDPFDQSHTAHHFCHGPCVSTSVCTSEP